MRTRSFGSHPGRTADPSTSPDFLLILLALTDFMRFSPTENRTRGCVQCSVAGNPGSLGMTNLDLTPSVGLRKYGWKDSLRSKQHNALCHPNRPHPWKRSPPPCHPERTRTSCHAALDTAACAVFRRRKPHEVSQRQQDQQEIRGSRGICSAPRMAPKGSAVRPGWLPKLRVLTHPLKPP